MKWFLGMDEYRSQSQTLNTLWHPNTKVRLAMGVQ